MTKEINQTEQINVFNVIANPKEYKKFLPLQNVDYSVYSIGSFLLNYYNSEQDCIIGSGGHTFFTRNDKKNKLVINTDSNCMDCINISDYDNVLNFLYYDEKKREFSNFLSSNMFVHIGTELSSGTGFCIDNTYYNLIFFNKCNKKYSDALAKFIKQNNSKAKTMEELRQEFPKRRAFETIGRSDGYFYVRMSYKDKDGKEQHKALDLLEYKYCVDYVKVTQSLTFINAFTARYKQRFKKEPTIGKLNIPLKDYVDFFTAPDGNGRPQSHALHTTAHMLILEHWKKNNMFPIKELQNQIEQLYANYCNKTFKFDNFLKKVIKNNKLKISLEELKEIFQDSFNATSRLEQMFILTEKSEELKQEIQNYKDFIDDPYGYMHKLEKEYGQMRREEFRTKKITDIYKNKLNKKIDYSKVKSKIDKGKNKILKTTAQARKIDKQGQKL